jgi:hypothetical protein
MTQFGRSLHALNIDILCANTPHAKGRVERANKTLQDRLVKELRLQGIGTIAAGNELLPGFLTDYNARFGKEPHNPKNLHRPLSAGDDLTDVFAWREERTVSNSLTLQYDKVLFLLEPNEITRELRRQRVTVVDYPDGRLAIRSRGLDLPYTTFDKLRQVLAGDHCREQAPWRRSLADPRAAVRTRRSSQPVRATPPRADQPYVQSRLSRIQPPHSEVGTPPARRHCLSVPILRGGRSPFHHQINELLSSSSTPFPQCSL